MKISSMVFPLLFAVCAPFAAGAGILLPGLQAPASVIRDSNGIAHIYADNEHDLFYMQGRMHARDRLFQMDLLRRRAAGTLAEVLGLPALQSDVEARVIGLHRAAERSLAAHPQAMIDLLQAYSDGVNSFLDEVEATGQLPPEYASLKLNSVRRWQPIDSVLVGKALAAATSLIVGDDIELTIALGTYQALGAATGAFDGSALFFEDLYRSAPFDPAITVADSLTGFDAVSGGSGQQKKRAENRLDAPGPGANARLLEDGRDYLKRMRELPRLPGMLAPEAGDMGGSNSWVIGGQHTPNGRPLLANDIHLQLDNPTLFHEIHLAMPGLDVTGSSLPGAPCVIRGHNDAIAWGVTNARLDITDIYADVIVPYPGESHIATLHDGVAEPVELVTESFRVNFDGQVVAFPPATRDVYIVPRRNHGPLITEPAADPQTGIVTALSVQSVGFGPTRDPEGLCAINRAHNLQEFRQALQLVDFASQNFTYADRAGNIAFFVSGEVPLREDLQNPAGSITPPFLIRNGFAGNEWVALAGPLPAHQATPFEILPFDEMPQVVNPASGIIVNANNDPLGNTLDNNPLNDLRANGNGLRYLNWGGRNFSIRAGRITEMIEERLSRPGRAGWRQRTIAFGQIKEMQADTVLNDARALAPYIQLAYENATDSNAHPALAALVSDPRIAEAVGRLDRWNFTTPTGIAEGYDAGGEIDAENSVAATIYSLWRGRLVANSIDATLAALAALPGAPANIPAPGQREEVVTALKHLLERDGIGVSGLNFFNVPNVDDAGVRRDILVLASLRDTLDLLASDAFAPAFGNSTRQDDYRWGRLHRIVFRHPLGAAAEALNVPPAFGLFPPPLDGLDGIPTDGGFETVDEAPPLDNVRAGDSDSFMFGFGPTGRFVARTGPRGIRAETSLPGGESARADSPFYLNLLEPYLRNETLRLLVSRREIVDDAVSIEEYLPGT